MRTNTRQQARHFRKHQTHHQPAASHAAGTRKKCGKSPLLRFALRSVNHGREDKHVVSLEDIQIPRLKVASSANELRQFERHAAAGKLFSPYRGMFVDVEEWSRTPTSKRAQRVIATLADKHPQWVFCLFSAATVYGLEVGRDDLAVIHLQCQGRTRQNKNGTIVRHHHANPTFVEVNGIRITPPLQTVVDCLCALAFDRALAIADSAMRVLGVTKRELQDELDSRGNCAGWQVARDAIAYANPLSANGGESVARAVMIEQGFMIPKLQAKMHDPLNPTNVYYVDFLWELGDAGDVIGELDGRDKYVLPEMTGGRDALEVMRDERHRESRITALRARVLRFTFKDVMDVGRFTKMLELYGVPRGMARPIGK